MTIEKIKELLDACYQAKRVRELLPELPKGVTSSYIHYLDTIASGTAWNTGEGIGHQRCTEYTASRGNTDGQGNGKRRLSSQRFLRHRWTYYISYDYR